MVNLPRTKGRVLTVRNYGCFAGGSRGERGIRLTKDLHGLSARWLLPLRGLPLKRDGGCVLQRESQQISLGLKAVETLLLMLRNRQRVVSRHELMKAVWPDTVIEENNLE